jgi:ABC-type multidrug transport system fused ATPase/permease subunit
MNWLLSFLRKIKDEIEGRIVKVIASVIIIVVLASCVIFWEWLKAQHSLQLFGWLWVLIVLAISMIPALLVFLINRQRSKQIGECHTDDKDITNKLKEWFSQYTERRFSIRGRQEETINFSDLDKELNLARGSTKRHIAYVVKGFPGWGTKDKGKDTIVIFRQGITFTTKIRQ